MKRISPTQRYSKAVVFDSQVQLSGLISQDWDCCLEDQAQDVFQQIDELLAQVGSSRSYLVSLMCWLSNIEDYDAFNRVYDKWIDTENLPARATVRADLIDRRLKIEIMATARIPV